NISEDDDAENGCEQYCRIEEYGYLPGGRETVGDCEPELADGCKYAGEDQRPELHCGHGFILPDEKRQQDGAREEGEVENCRIELLTTAEEKEHRIYPGREQSSQ